MMQFFTTEFFLWKSADASTISSTKFESSTYELHSCTKYLAPFVKGELTFSWGKVSPVMQREDVPCHVTLGLLLTFTILHFCFAMATANKEWFTATEYLKRELNCIPDG